MAGASSTPAGVLPMLATPGPVPDGSGWAFEFTWDGARALADVGPHQVRLIGGNSGDSAVGYPELDVLPSLIKRRVLLDGKIVSLDAFGRPSMSRLQHRMRLRRPTTTALRRVPVAYYVFDLLRLDDRCTLHLPYQQRRELLDELDLTAWPIVLPPYFLDTDGHAVLDTAAQYGLHGVVAKRVDSTYQPGRRSRSWVQTTLRRRQEVVIGGWVPGKDEPADVPAAVLVGVPSETGLRYVGRIRSGLTEAACHELRDRFAGIGQQMSPFADKIPLQSARDARWVVPELLCEVSYRRWTTHGRLSYASWIGLRESRHPAAIHPPTAFPGSPPQNWQVTIAGNEPDSGWEAADEEQLEEALRRAQAEVNALRVQISPHFVFNALATIAMLIKTDPRRARELLMDFAGFTRYTFRPPTELTTLADELESIEHYLALEQARLESRLRVTIKTAAHVLPAVLPFLALQTVVQSAVRHGIEELPEGGCVTISAVEADDDFLITVEGDGPAVWARTGLEDVDERLRMAFGDEYGLATDSPPGGATTVAIRVPKPEILRP
jgi:bifunctional non-homologous end joining protein LigD